jgi:hypothetical protein
MCLGHLHMVDLLQKLITQLVTFMAKSKAFKAKKAFFQH